LLGEPEGVAFIIYFSDLADCGGTTGSLYAYHCRLNLNLVGGTTKDTGTYFCFRAVPGCGTRYNAFGDIGTMFRQLEWKTPIVFESVVPKTPNASYLCPDRRGDEHGRDGGHRRVVHAPHCPGSWGGHVPFAISTENSFCMAILYGRDDRVLNYHFHRFSARAVRRRGAAGQRQVILRS
jgi:hypothetical protein